MKKVFFPFTVLLLIAFHSCMDEPAIQPNTAKGNFKALWEIIDMRYCYLDYKKINWDSVYNVYEPRVTKVKTKYEFFDLMAGMLAVLKDGHVNLYSEFDQSRYWKWYSDYPENFNSDVIFNDRYLGSDYRIAGGFRYKKIANGNVGYMYCGSFSTGFSNTQIKSILDIFSGCKGLIIDVRNNGGGTLTNAEQLASYFFREKTLTSYISHKTGNGHSDLSKPKAVYTSPNENIQWQRPVMILTNRMSYSATNDFVCRMQYAPNSFIIGDQTGGGGGLPFSSELPNGWMIRFSASPSFNAEMENIEWGIQPDIKIDMDTTSEKMGYDTIIERAVIEILK